MKTIDLYPVTSERLSFEEFLTRREKHGVFQDVRIIPPSFGGNLDDDGDFGGIMVSYLDPIYQTREVSRG